MTDSSPPSRSTAVAIACWAVILGTVAAIGVVQHRRERAATDAAATSTATGPGLDLLVAGRLAVSVAQRPQTTDLLRQQLRANVAGLAVRPVDRLALAVVVRELSGPAAAAEQVKADSAAASSPRLRADAAALAKLYGAGTAPSAGERADLAADLGYFGRLAATQAEGSDAAARGAVLAEAMRTTVVTTAAAVLGIGAFAIGFVGLAVMVVLFALGTLRFTFAPVPPTSGRPVWLEAFAVWMVTFVTLSFAASRLPVRAPLVVTETVLAGLTVSLAVAWPAWRGRLPVSQARRALGWHVGRGVLVEMACGIAGYVVGLPIVALGAGLTLLAARLSGAHPSHPIVQDLGERMPAGHVASLLLAAAVLAPVLEETVFRGALYAHLRRRHAAWVSGGVVAVLFAAIHPQGWAAIPLLGSIAVVLAFLREWRDSLIAPITAHAVNNGVVLLVVALALG